MVPSSPKVPCSTGKMTSTSIACFAVPADVLPLKGISECWSAPVVGTGGTMTASPLASTAAEAVASGSPARSDLSSWCLPSRRRSAWTEVTQRPSLVMPMGTTSYLLRSIALSTDAADNNETSCSPLRPPKRTPTRIFFAIIRSRRVENSLFLIYHSHVPQRPAASCPEVRHESEARQEALDLFSHCCRYCVCAGSTTRWDVPEPTSHHLEPHSAQRISGERVACDLRSGGHAGLVSER